MVDDFKFSSFAQLQNSTPVITLFQLVHKGHTISHHSDIRQDCLCIHKTCKNQVQAKVHQSDCLKSYIPKKKQSDLHGGSQYSYTTNEGRKTKCRAIPIALFLKNTKLAEKEIQQCSTQQPSTKNHPKLAFTQQVQK